MDGCPSEFGVQRRRAVQKSPSTKPTTWANFPNGICAYYRQRTTELHLVFARHESLLRFDGTVTDATVEFLRTRERRMSFQRMTQSMRSLTERVQISRCVGLARQLRLSQFKQSFPCPTSFCRESAHSSGPTVMIQQIYAELGQS